VSDQNVEIVRSLFEAWLRGDMGLDLLDRDISMVETATFRVRPPLSASTRFDATSKASRSTGTRSGSSRRSSSTQATTASLWSLAWSARQAKRDRSQPRLGIRVDCARKEGPKHGRLRRPR